MGGKEQSFQSVQFHVVREEVSCSPMQSNHHRCSIKKAVLKNLSKLTGKHLCQSLFLNKIAGRPGTLFKKRLQGDYFCQNAIWYYIDINCVKLSHSKTVHTFA